MIKEALEYFANLKKDPIITIDEKKYNVRLDNALIPIEKVQQIGINKTEEINTHTLTSIIDYLKLNPDELDLKKMYIHINNYNFIELSSTITGDYREKEKYIIAKSLVPEKKLNQFLDIESFLIMLNSGFIMNEDLENIIRIVSKVIDNKIVNYEDDGISQKVNIKSGIELIQEEKLPRLNQLKPFRTFIEVDQPESYFLLRAKKELNELNYALYEADGGAWKNKAIENIKEYLNISLSQNKINIPILA